MEDRQTSKEDRMRNLFGLNKQNNAPKLRTVIHQMSAYSHDAAGGAAEEVDTMRAQISELHARVAAILTRTQLRDLQAQEEAMKTCISDKERPKENQSSS